MKTYKLFSGAELNIPEKLSEMTVRQLIKLQKIGDLNDPEKIINIFSTTPITIDDVSYKQFTDIIGSIGSLFSVQPDLFPVESFVFNDECYVAKSVEELFVKEYIDFENLASDPVENLPLLLAIIYHPTNEQIDDYPNNIHKRAELFQDLDAQTAQAGLVFFSKDFMKYVKNTTESLGVETPEMKQQMKVLKELIDSDGI